MTSLDDITSRFEAALKQSSILEGRVSRQLVAGQVGRVAVAGHSKLSAVQARAWGEIRPGQKCLIAQDSAGGWHALPADAGTQLVSRQLVSYRHSLPEGRDRPIYPFKIVFKKLNEQGNYEFYLGGDRPPQLLKTVNPSASPKGYVANFGPGLDQWCAYIAYGGQYDFTIEYFDSQTPEGVRVNPVPYRHINYLGSGIWSSGATRGQISCTSEGLPETQIVTTSQSFTVTETILHIQILYSTFNSLPGYVDRVSTWTEQKRIREEIYDYSSDCRSDVFSQHINASPSLSANTGNYRRIHDDEGYKKECAIIAPFPGTYETSVYSDLYYSPPVEQVRTVVGQPVCENEDYSIPGFNRHFDSLEESVEILVAPGLQLRNFVESSKSYSSAGDYEERLSQQTVQPLLSGQTSCLYGRSTLERTYINSGIPTQEATNGLYFNDLSAESLVSTTVSNLYPPFKSNLIDSTVYVANPATFTSAGDFESPVTVKPLPSGEAKIEVGTVYALGDPSEVRIESMVYWPPSLA